MPHTAALATNPAPAAPALLRRPPIPAAKKGGPRPVLPEAFHKPHVVRPAASPARSKRRHRRLIASFALFVLAPILLAAGYLYDRAADQFASDAGFAVRKEEGISGIDLLGGLGDLGGGDTADADILHAYLQSQDLVIAVEAQIDLRAAWSAPHARDPLFALDPEASLEDLVDYWQRMVRVSYDPGSGLIEMHVRAFEAADAQRIAEVVLSRSGEMINALSDQAQEDATRHARRELSEAEARLQDARARLTRFRATTRVVDPAADVQSQMGLIDTLQQQLADEMIKLDLLRNRTRDTDPRVEQAERRIEIIEGRIEAERQKFGTAAQDRASYAETVSEFERLTAEREFAEGAYVAARAALDAAVAEARRQSRYLAAFIAPTRAETARFPDRPLILLVASLFAVLLWAIGTLVFYSLRDRR
ncbi:sugar transporter [Tropicimonas sp. IMCC34011]|uniref:sugar transporter n=1 Tax=Tropicimonas sp. IMCC34011 TaxID=2248759 RepID=UPI001E509C3B|nr:sugar transporter [Tropicimonas sp. IMCC34011]